MEEKYLIEIKLKRDEIVSFDVFPFCLNGIKSLETLKLNPAVTFFIGENGSGKSTLLEAIAVACGFNPEGGTSEINYTETEHFLVTKEFLSNHERMLRVLMDE